MKTNFWEYFKHLVLLAFVPYDHYGCRHCEKITAYYKERLHSIAPPPPPPLRNA